MGRKCRAAKRQSEQRAEDERKLSWTRDEEEGGVKAKARKDGQKQAGMWSVHSYDGRASLSCMRDTSSYSATETNSSMGQMRPYSSQPFSITKGSDLWGSNMMLLGVTINTPPTTP